MQRQTFREWGLFCILMVFLINTVTRVGEGGYPMAFPSPCMKPWGVGLKLDHAKFRGIIYVGSIDLIANCSGLEDQLQECLQHYGTPSTLENSLVPRIHSLLLSKNS